jgi:thiamine kinase-like enzyme
VVTDLADIIDRLVPLLGPASGEAAPLNGGITNRNYRVRLGGEDYVIRLPGKDTALLGIDRDAECEANAAAAQLGIAPAVAATLVDCIVTRYTPSEPVSAADLRAAPQQIATALRLFHDRGPTLPVRFWVPDLLADYERVVRDRGGRLPDAYHRAAELAQRIAAALPPTQPVPCHDDLLTSNILRTREPGGGRLVLVDWEYAGMGERLFDLANLSVNNDFDLRADVALLTAYFDEPPDEALLAGLALMRIMSDIREAAWGVIQSVISELDFDFADYAQRHFARLLEAASGRRFEELLDAAA